MLLITKAVTRIKFRELPRKEAALRRKSNTSSIWIGLVVIQSIKWMQSLESLIKRQSRKTAGPVEKVQFGWLAAAYLPVCAS